MIAINDFGEKAIKLIDNKTKIVMQFPGNAIDFKKIDLVPTHNKKYEAIFCGAIDEGKGVFDTVGAWHLVAKKVPNCQLAIIGRGTQKTVTDLKSRIQEAGLKGNISTPFDLLVGAEQEELWEYIKQAKVFIYPSLKDVFPAVVLEALACGIPVITYDSPWAVTFDKCPALIKVKMKDTNALAEQAVSIIMHHDQNKVFFENSAKQFAKQFNWDDLVLAEKRCYLKAIKEWGDRK